MNYNFLLLSRQFNFLNCPNLGIPIGHFLLALNQQNVTRRRISSRGYTLELTSCQFPVVEQHIYIYYKFLHSRFALNEKSILEPGKAKKATM